MKTAELLNTTGKRIRALRGRKGITQTELAEILDVAPSYVSQMESDKRLPAVENLIKLANMLDCTTDHILMLSDDVTPDVAQASYSTPEAKQAAELIDSLPEQQRAFCVELVNLVAKVMMMDK